jgi:hypothetical protein
VGGSTPTSASTSFTWNAGSAGVTGWVASGIKNHPASSLEIDCGHDLSLCRKEG